MICTTGGTVSKKPFFKRPKGVCGRDLGGPLVCLEDGIPKLAGVVSYAEGCGDFDHPGIHTKVSAFIDWIKQSMETVPLAFKPCRYEWIGDNHCDDENNHPACDYDGGDCSDTKPDKCTEPMWIGDGNCDDENNFKECDFDDGDCCSDTKHLHCKICQCKEEPQECPRPYWIGDGNCDDENNVAACDFDGNDCCTDVQHKYCHKCTCKKT